MKVTNTKRAILGFAAALAILLSIGPALIAAAQNVPIYFNQSATTLTVGSGGTLAINAASNITIGGVSPTGVVKSGTVTLDGSNPTPVTTGLTTVVTGVVTQKKATPPGDDPIIFTVGYSGGTLNVYAWKTDGSDPTLVASTDSAATVDWIAVGS